MKQKLHQPLGSPGRLPGNPVLKTVGKALFLFLAIVFSAGRGAIAQGCTEPTITATTSATICGFGTATVTATASAGTVNWYTASTGGSSVQSGTTLNRFMPPGSSSVTYYVGATDGSCTTTTRTAVTISVYEKPTISATASPSPACVGNVLSLSASATGGASPYSYSWSGPDGFTVSASTTATASTSPLTIDGAGFYNLTVTDANGCTATSGTNVSVYTNPVLDVVGTPNPVCTGNTLFLTSGYNSGGSGVATYVWTGPNGFTATGANPTHNNATSSSAGVYSVTATDSRGCIGRGSTSTVSVITNSVTLTVTGSTNICSGAPTTLTSTGGSTYDWNPGTALSQTSGASVTASPTSSITYTVTGRVGNCYNTATVAVVVLAEYVVTASTTTTNGTISDAGTTNVCAGTDKTYIITPASGYHIADVQVDGTSIGNVPPFVIRNVTGPHTITADFAPNCTAPTISCTGNVTQSAGSGACNATVTYSAATATGTSPSITYSQNSGTTFSVGVTTVTATATNSCGTASCSFNVTVTPNTLGVSASPTNVSCYGGSNGAIATTVTGGSGSYSYSWTGGASGANPTGLAAGTYTVTVTDNGCSAVSPVSASVTITQPSTLSASSSVTNVLCNGGATGAVSVTATGGTGTISGTGSFTGLSAGSYSYTVTDANGCTATTSGSITQPSALSATSSVTNVLCNGGTSGAVSVSATGGTGAISGTGSFTGLSAGSYNYTVTDANGCTATTSGSITQPSALSASSSVTNVLCNGGTSGAVSVSATGGTGTISGTGSFTGLSAGSYSYTVTDANGCSATTSGSITQPSALSASSSVTNVLCNGGTTGAVSVSATGGTGTISGTGSFTGLGAGSYSYTVTDANGCTAATSGSITEPSAISISSTATNISCHSSNGGNHSDGSIATTVSGGTGSYSYAWSGGANGANPSGLAAGTYSVTVTDANGCTATSSATVSQPSVLSATLTPTNVSCGSTSNGSVAASVSGGTSGYTYLWSNSQTNATNTGLTAATYSVTVTDAHSCTTTGSATVSSGSGITCSITGSTSVLGAVATTYTGPSGMTSYSWSVTGGDHVCDAHCHHHGSHSCGSGCDHYSQSCASGCHHHSGHSCSNNHHGDHHCNRHCHHHGSHSCSSNCDHHGQSCSSGCHHHSSHHCNHQHCSSPTISGSSTGSSVIINSPCSATAYSVTLTVTNSTGCSATSTSEVTVTPSATITVYSTLYTTGSGQRPSTTKSVLATNLKVFTRSTSRRRSGNQSNYSSIWNSTTGQVTNVSISSPTSVNIGGGPAYRYTVTVPANGRYLVVGQSVVSSTRCGGTTCTLYTGKKVGGQDDCDGDQHGRDDDDDDDVAPCSNTKVRFHSILKDQSGRCRELDTHEEHGSLMMVVTPMELDFDDSVSYLPVIYESVEGEWNVSVTAEPPYGFYTEPSGELSTSVTDSVMNTLQFAVIDTGSEWTFTQLTHQIKHKGEDRVARSKPIMVNERTNKPVELNLSPNPADDNIRITMPKFEGRATIYVYNMVGQQVASQPIEIISGFSVSMDISSLAPGVYMVTAENTNGKASSRLIKSEK